MHPLVWPCVICATKFVKEFIPACWLCLTTVDRMRAYEEASCFFRFAYLVPTGYGACPTLENIAGHLLLASASFC